MTDGGFKMAPGAREYNPAGRNSRSVWTIEQETLDPSLPPEKPRGPDGRRQTHVEGRDGSAQHRSGERWPNEGGPNARSVWTIATQPYPEAHFATFPSELARRCILAGTSERGCCPECGAPWVRKVEHVADRPNNRAGRAASEQRRRLGKTSCMRTGTLPVVETIGWESTCGHGNVDASPTRWGPAHPVPCTVLDPFAGSGTVGHVARQHGRSSILIELSETYCELIAKRTQQQSLLA